MENNNVVMKREKMYCQILDNKVFFQLWFLLLVGLNFFVFNLKTAKAQQDKEKLVENKIDFSFAGYGGGGIALPNIPTILNVHSSGGDDTRLLQAAIDSIGNLPIQNNGFRGAVQLSEGNYVVNGQLSIPKGGIVLRGSKDPSKTIITAAGKARRTLITVGKHASLAFSDPIQIINNVVPTGSQTFTLQSLDGLKVGDRVTITRPSTLKWIYNIGMNKLNGIFADQRLHWSPGSRDLTWDRVISALNRKKYQVTVDAPITTKLEQKYGGGIIRKVIKDNIITNIIIQGLTINSKFDTSSKYDEEHSWIGIKMNHIEDAWLSNIIAKHFVSSAIHIGHRARRITISNVHSEQPISEIGGYRRYTFWVDGQQILVENCTSDSGINDFAVGFCSAGPNVFLDCTATNALGPSGSFESWSSGNLYEDVSIKGAGLNLTYDMSRSGAERWAIPNSDTWPPKEDKWEKGSERIEKHTSSAAGWTAANSVIWNSHAKEIEAQGPFEAPNFIINSSNSLYYSQLKERVKSYSVANSDISTQYYPKKNTSFFKSSDIPKEELKNVPTKPLKIVNGRFVIEDSVVWGGQGNHGWGEVTRYYPGRVGPHYTVDLSKLALQLKAHGTPFFYNIISLWYDRRRSDHSIAKEKDGGVWAPFAEMPWARSGEGTAWDGLSLYDLTKYNSWYFKRVKKFEHLSDQNGLILFHSLYNTHNVIEIFAHWSINPWRPANNINHTGLPEPPPLKPWRRWEIANQFYNPDNQELRKLHKAYIFHTLDELASAKNIIFDLANEYAGPLNFQRFFLDTIAEWEKEHNKKVLVDIRASKNVTDSILADSKYAREIDIIDTRYWQYRPYGDLWAPQGGINRSYREMNGDAFTRLADIAPPTTEEQLYRQVREYHDKYPDKAIVDDNQGAGIIPVLMAGGAEVIMDSPQGMEFSQTPFYSFFEKNLSTILMKMEPNDVLLKNKNKNWCMSNKGNALIFIYARKGQEIRFPDTFDKTQYNGIWFDPLQGRSISFDNSNSSQKKSIINKLTKGKWLLLLKSKK